MQGYIKLYRQIMENEFYKGEKFTKVQAWVDLLLLANHKVNIIYVRGIEINLKPGELAYSQISLAERWKWNFKTVKRYLTSLENRKMILCKNTNVTTIITILNWNRFQGNGEQNGEQRESKRETDKNVKNEKKTTSTENIKSQNNLNSLVSFYCKILNKKPESSDYSYIKRILKLKESDDLTHMQKCSMLRYTLNQCIDDAQDKKFKGIIYNKYKELDFATFEDSSDDTEDDFTDTRIIINDISDLRENY